MRFGAASDFIRHAETGEVTPVFDVTVPLQKM